MDFPHPSVVEAKVTVAAADGKSIELQVQARNNVSVGKHGVVFGSHGEGWTLDGTTGLTPVAQSDHRARTLVRSQAIKNLRSHFLS